MYTTTHTETTTMHKQTFPSKLSQWPTIPHNVLVTCVSWVLPFNYITNCVVWRCYNTGGKDTYCSASSYEAHAQTQHTAAEKW